jgi:hypothetical protein
MTCGAMTCYMEPPRNQKACALYHIALQHADGVRLSPLATPCCATHADSPAQHNLVPTAESAAICYARQAQLQHASRCYLRFVFVFSISKVACTLCRTATHTHHNGTTTQMPFMTTK